MSTKNWTAQETGEGRVSIFQGERFLCETRTGLDALALVNELNRYQAKLELFDEMLAVVQELEEQFRAYQSGWLVAPSQWRDRIGLPVAIKQAIELIAKAKSLK